MEFNKRKLKFKFEGEEYTIPFPPVKLLSRFNKELSAGNEIDAVIGLLEELGLDKKVLDEMEIEHLVEIVEVLSGQKKS